MTLPTDRPRSGLPCSFCAAIAGAVKTTVLYESSEALAWFPLRPAARGHTLVVPRKHTRDLWELDPVDAGPLAKAVLRVAQAIRHGLRPDGLNVITSAGIAATQSVLHMHVHLIPRWHGDKFGSIWPDPTPSFTSEQKRDSASAICAFLE